MIAREIFTDYSLGADQLGTPIEKSHHIFCQHLIFVVKQYWPNFFEVFSYFCEYRSIFNKIGKADFGNRFPVL